MKLLPLAGAALLLLSGCAATSPTAADAPSLYTAPPYTEPAYTSPPDTSTPPPAPTVTYTVTGDGTAHEITYYTTGGLTQTTKVALPWTFTGPRSGGLGVYEVLAQDGTGTTISCAITDQTGHTLASNTATGQFAVVMCVTK